MVARPTATAAELSTEEFVEGRKILEAKVRRYRPRCLALLGVTAYRIAFSKPQAQLGLQDESIGDTRVWILPNPSGLNAHYQPKDLARLFKELRRAMSR